MKTKILVCGLPGAGKTTLANKLVELLISNGLVVCSLNADELRDYYDDWDFSVKGRIRQAIRMRDLANESSADYVIADFVAPLPSLRDIYSPDYLICMDTITEGRFADTNAIYEPPTLVNRRVTSFDPLWLTLILQDLAANHLIPHKY